MSDRSLSLLGGASGVVGVAMIGVSFALNPGPPPGLGADQLAGFARQHLAAVAWAAWLQAVGPALIVTFAVAVVFRAGAHARPAGWLTLLGGALLVLVSATEVVFYLAALMPAPAGMAALSLAVIAAVQHLYFVVAAPALFGALGWVIVSSAVLPRWLGASALALGGLFAVVGLATATTLVLPAAVTALGAAQAPWWLIAAVVLLRRAGPPEGRPSAGKIPRATA